MAEFPALPMFTDALLADAGYLNNEKFGAYIRILILIWRTSGCRIPARPEWLMEKLSVSAETYAVVHGPLLEEFCQSDGNYITQKRLMKEFNYLRKNSKKNSDNAKARWNKKKDPCDRNAKAGNAPDPTPPQPVDFKKVIFDEGLRWICEQSKRTPTTMRSLVGKWIRDHGEQAVAGAIMAAQKASAVEPVSFIEKTLREKKNGQSGAVGGGRSGASKSERFKQAIHDTTLADIEADERSGGAEAVGKPSGLLL